MKWKNLFPINKIPYLQKKKDIKYCILCEVINNTEKEKNLKIYQNSIATIIINLYPYNVGHIMIVPNRHIVDIREMTEIEEKEINRLTKCILNLLEKEYNAKSFNIGYNIGENSGASISHLHLHIVPRYPNELGFIDIIAGSKLIVEDPVITKERLIKAINKYV